MILDVFINKQDNQIVFSYNGKGFIEDDVWALCSAGQSTKINNAVQTGYKGISFKSVFSNSNKVTIVSNRFQFRFDKEFCLNEMSERYNVSRNDIKFSWQFHPLWKDLNEIEVKILQFINDYSVNIIIDICDEKHFIDCKETILELQQNQAYLLFLKSKNISNSAYDLIERECIYQITKKWVS